MRARALGGLTLFSLLFILLMAATGASSLPQKSAAVLASTPEWSSSLLQPTGWVQSTPVTCAVTVYNQGGLLTYGRYRYSTNGGASWSAELDQGLTVVLDAAQTTAILTAANVPFPLSVTPSQNQIQFSVWDNLGLQWWSGSYIVQVDNTRPTSSVSSAGCYRTWPGAISGTATDSGSGVSTVEIQIRRSDSWYFNGSSWQPTPVWLAAVGTTSWSYSLVPAEDTYSIQSRARDLAGNQQSPYGQGTFVYDTTEPRSEVVTVGYFNSPENWLGLLGSSTDTGSGVAYVDIMLQRGTLYYNGSSWVSTPTWLQAAGTASWSYPFTPTIEARYEVKARATDACGNVESDPAVGAFTYDATAPLSPSNLAVTPSTWTKDNSFTLGWQNPADVAGIIAAHFKWNSAPTHNDDEDRPQSPIAGDGIQSIVGLRVPRQGTHQLYIWLEDKADNKDYRNHSATDVRSFKWDATAPATSITGVVGSQGCAGWYTSTVQIGLSAVDVNPDPATINETSGVSATFWRLDGGDWRRVSASSFELVEEGPHTVEYYSVDVAGNGEVHKLLSPTVKIDTVAPTTGQPTYTGTLGRNGWYTSSVSVSLSPFDATSGVSATYYQVDTDALQSGSTFLISADGVHSIRYYSVDAACNQEAMQTAAQALKIDKVSPASSYQLNGRVGDNGWFLASPVTVTLDASDVVTGVQTSGVDSLRYRIGAGSWQQYSSPLVIAVPAGQTELLRTIEYYATDFAGNVEPTQVVTVGIDFRAPSAMPIAPYAVPSGWTKNNCFDIRWVTNPDDLSGIGGAYYSFSIPISSTDGTLVPGDSIMSIPCIQVSPELGDGAHNVYVWLRDRAGNSDHLARHVVPVYLDRTPPVLTPQVSGRLCGTAGWYNTPVTVTFVATDNVPQGMVGGVISYHVVGTGDWVRGSSYVELRDGRYAIEGQANDAAGNTSEVVTASIRVDQTAPPAPISLQVEPAGWSRTNSFTLSWLNPQDLSGLSGLYYKLGSLPISPTDGISVSTSQSSLSVSATAEGEVPVYLWLVDRACNSDHQRRASATLKYDNTAPSTTFFASGSLGADGWYVSPVTVELHCEDYASGWAGSYYRIGDGPWRSGTSFAVMEEGVVSFSYYSADVAGNIETPRTGSVKIDRTPPFVYAYADSHSASSSFTVHWTGSDNASDIAAFDVQYKVGPGGQWQNWMSVNPPQESGLFSGALPGKCYYFRARARDRAGNEQPYPAAADVYVCVDPLLNGSFERSGWIGWQTGWIRWPESSIQEGCSPTLVITQSYSGGSTQVALLGCAGPRNGAPVGASLIHQTISVPSRQDWPAPMLEFRYRIYTYDVLKGVQTGKLFDSLNVGLCSVGGIEPTCVFTDSLFMDGNRAPEANQWRDLGWRQGAVDLRAYAGATVSVYLANATRVDTYYNTWTVVDDVRLVNLEYRLHLPAILRDAPASAQAQSKSTRTDSRVER